MNKIILYFDYLKRFNGSQLIHLIKSRSSNMLLFRARNRPLKSSDRIDDTSLEDFLIRYKLLFTTKDEHSVIIDEVCKGELVKDKYYNELQNRLIKSMEKNELSESIWSTYDSSDIEIQNNFFRFHLFSEAATSVKLTSSLRKQLILKWLSIKVQDKIAQNSFNCALRLFNWFKLISKLEPTDFSFQEWRQIKDSIFNQILFVNRNIEHHIPGNHVFIQLFMIWMAAALFPKWIRSKEILNCYSIKLTTEVEKQFLKESGLHFELSTHYHVQILQFLLLWINASRRIDINVSPNVESTAKKALHSFTHLCFSDEYIPILGDNCYPFIHSSLRSDIKNILQLNSSLFNDNLTLHKNENKNLIIDIDQQYLVSIIKDSKVILDVGELGYPPNPGHGHSDLMSIVYFDKIPVLIDPGTRRYTNNPEDLLLKNSRSHNTISINNKDYAILWGFFRWSFLPDKPIYSTKCADTGNILDVSYKWLKIQPGITQKRKIFHNESLVEIIDFIEGDMTADVTSNFILHQDIKYELINNQIKLSAPENSWNVSVESNSNFAINIHPFTIYLQYNLPEESNQIKIVFKKARFPIEIKTTITRLEA